MVTGETHYSKLALETSIRGGKSIVELSEMYLNRLEQFLDAVHKHFFGEPPTQ